MFCKALKGSVKILLLGIFLVFMQPHEILCTDFTAYATLAGHKQGVVKAVFSKDGKYLSLSNKDFYVNIWDVETGKSLVMMDGFNEWPAQVAYSPDSKLLVTSDYEKIKIWEVPSGKPYKVIEKAEDPFALSPNGKYLVGKFKPSDMAYQLKLYSFPSGDMIKNIENAHEKIIRCVSWSQNGTVFASSSDDGKLKIWDGKTGELLREISTDKKVGFFRFSPKGIFIAAIVGEDPGSFFKSAQVDIWEVSSGKLIKKIEGFNKGLETLAFSPDGNYFATGERGPKASLWKIPSWELEKTFDGHKYWVSHVAFSPNGKYLATGSADELTLWNIAKGKKIKSAIAAGQGLTSVVFSPDGKVIATTSTDNTVKLWKLSEK